jgi:hypothetical protein
MSSRLKSEPVKQLRKTISSAQNRAASLLQKLRTMPPPVYPAVEEESEELAAREDPRKDKDE